MLSRNAVAFIAAQFGSRFANSFLTTAVRYELLEVGGVAKFASAQVANQLVRVFMQQVSGVLTDRYPLKLLYVLGESANLLLVLALVPSIYGVSLTLFMVNVGLGLTQAFSQPVSKSMPPAVASPDDLAIVNSWDLTGDKVGRNLAPMAFTIISSTAGYGAAVSLSLLMFGVLVMLKQALHVADQPGKEKRSETAGKSSDGATVFRRSLEVFKQVWEGIVSLKRDRTIGLLILNTLATNMLVYPLSNLVFPVIFKAIPEGAIESEESLVSAVILRLQSALGIHRKKAWMNYAAVVSLGGVIGPFLSNAMVYWIKGLSAKHPERVNWVGLNCGIVGQVITLAPLIAVLRIVQQLNAGMRIFLMFVVWGAMTAMNNVTTIYFNAHTQQRLSRSERGRFIANILTLFALASSMGSVIYGWALASGGAQAQVDSSTRILVAAVLLRVCVLAALRLDVAGRQTVLLRKKEDSGGGTAADAPPAPPPAEEARSGSGGGPGGGAGPAGAPRAVEGRAKAE